MTQTANAAAANLLNIAERQWARVNMEIQHHHERTLETDHVRRVRRRWCELRDAVTSAQGLIKTGHGVVAYRLLSEVLGS